MNLLVICQYYDPEPFRIHDLCAGLVQLGHSVQVVTGMPNYPAGDLYPGFADNKARDEVLDGVRIHRCPIHPRKHGALHRLWNYYSFHRQAGRYTSSSHCAAADGRPFDLVLVYQLSPVMMAKPALLYRRLHPVPILMYCLDLWPESLLAGGVSRDSFVFRFYHRVSARIYRSMDRILVTSARFAPYLIREFDIPAARIRHLPQYAEDLFRPLPPRKRDGIVNLTFAGNVGNLQNAGILLDAATLLRQEPVVFHVVGDGSELEKLKKRAKDEDLQNVCFHGRRPLEEMPSLYAEADAMLVTMKNDPILSLTLPGKVQSYMASARPVIGSIGGETARVIAEADCGFCAPPEDPEALTAEIRRFLACDSPERLGQNARTYYDAHFTRTHFLTELDREISNLVFGERI